MKQKGEMIYMKLENMTVVVTGASSGTGKAIVELFVKEGANVVAVARREEKLKELRESLQDAYGNIEIYVGDVSKKETSESMIDFAVEKFGKLDVLINNAGIMDDMGPVGAVTDEKYNQVMLVNAYGPMCAMRKAVNVFMSQENGGSIINIGSEGAKKNSAGAAYCASKAAMEAISRNTAFMYVHKNIRCNVIALGAFRTEIANSIGKPNIEGYERTRIATASNPGLGEPMDVAYAALYLASDDAKFINGACLTVDGGWSAN